MFEVIEMYKENIQFYLLLLLFRLTNFTRTAESVVGLQFVLNRILQLLEEEFER